MVVVIVAAVVVVLAVVAVAAVAVVVSIETDKLNHHSLVFCLRGLIRNILEVKWL